MQLPARLAIAGLAILLSMILLLRFFPAGWMLIILQPSNPAFNHGSASGTIWTGQAEDVEFRDLKLGTIRWRLIGMNGWRQTRWHITGSGLDYDLDFELATHGRAVSAMRSIYGAVPAHWIRLADASAPLVPGGTIKIDLARVRFEDNGMPVEAHGELNWTAARLTGFTAVELGQVIIKLEPTDGRSEFTLQTAGQADLAMTGHGYWTAQYYRADLNLEVSPTRKTLQRLLESVGSPRPNGSIDVQFNGELARSF